MVSLKIKLFKDMNLSNILFIGLPPSWQVPEDAERIPNPQSAYDFHVNAEITRREAEKAAGFTQKDVQHPSPGDPPQVSTQGNDDEAAKGSPSAPQNSDDVGSHTETATSTGTFILPSSSPPSSTPAPPQQG